MHWLTSGQAEWQQGREPADFDVDGYLRGYADLQAAFGGDLGRATLHWLLTGRAEGRLGRFPSGA